MHAGIMTHVDTKDQMMIIQKIKSASASAVFIALTLIAQSPLANTNCRILLSGADHLASSHPDQMQQILTHIQSYVSTGRRADLPAYFIGVFGDQELKAAMAKAGVGQSAQDLVLKRVLHVAQKIYNPRANQPKLILNGFNYLIDNHDPKKAALNICIVGSGCPEFKVRNLDRPFVSVSVVEPVSLQPVKSIDLDLLDATSDFYFNTVFLRADSPPEDLVADLFSGIGSAAYVFILRAWVLSKQWDHRPDPLFAKFGRIVDGRSVLDIHFFEFMKTMSGHKALLEYLDIMPNTVPPESLQHPGRLSTTEDAFRNMSEGTRSSLATGGVTPSNANAHFEQFYDHIMNTLNGMNRASLN